MQPECRKQSKSAQSTLYQGSFLHAIYYPFILHSLYGYFTHCSTTFCEGVHSMLSQRIFPPRKIPYESLTSQIRQNRPLGFAPFHDLVPL